MGIPITYHFKFPKESGIKDLSFQFELSEPHFTFSPKNPLPDPVPDWANLSFHQCSHCPLNNKSSPHCPIAKNLSRIVDFFKDVISYQKCRVFIETSERSYAKETTVQDGLFPLFGVIMATSGCPHMDFFRPLARFHLPFATPFETQYRTTAHFLLKAYLGQDSEHEKPLDLNGLMEIYKNVEILNTDFLNRIRSVSKKDAELNAIVVLNCFGQMIVSDAKQEFGQLKELFLYENKK